jgi:hypothetical protein
LGVGEIDDCWACECVIGLMHIVVMSIQVSVVR